MSELPKGWSEKSLSELVDKIIDYRGKTPKKLGLDWSKSGHYRALSAKSVKTGELVNEEKINLGNEELYNKWMKDEVEYNDILLTSEAPMGEVIIWKSQEKIILSQRLFAIRIKENISPDYIYYYFISKRFQGELTARASGTTVIGIKQTELVKTNIILPGYEKQKAIANILSSFDNKIELLKEQNKTLETMAQTIFKEWFFKSDNQRYLKLIENTNIQILDGDRGKNYPKNNEFFSNEYCLFLSASNITLKGFSLQKTSFITKEKDSLLGKGKLNRYDIILTTRGTVGNVAYYTDNIKFENIRINSGMVIIRCNSIEESIYVYILMRSAYFKKLVEQVISGSAQPQLPIRDLKKISIMYPELEIINEFSNIVLPIYNKYFTNISQIETLSKTRDILLPKLMSGKIRVKGFEQ